MRWTAAKIFSNVFNSLFRNTKLSTHRSSSDDSATSANPRLSWSLIAITASALTLASCQSSDDERTLSYTAEEEEACRVSTSTGEHKFSDVFVENYSLVFEGSGVNYSVLPDSKVCDLRITGSNLMFKLYREVTITGDFIVEGNDNSLRVPEGVLDQIQDLGAGNQIIEYTTEYP